MCQQLAKVWRTIDFPGVSEFNQEPEEPLQGAKMTVMDILEFTDINGPAPKGEIWTNKAELVPAANDISKERHTRKWRNMFDC